MSSTAPSSAVAPPVAPAVAKFLDTLPKEVRERVEQLRGVQSQCDNLKKKFLEERNALEEKYRAMFEPLFKQRFDIVVGSEDQIQESDEPGMVPGFWLKVLKGADLVGGNVTKRDEPILKNLLDISQSPLEDGQPGFKLMFKFAPNPYFKPLLLEKKYYMCGDDEATLEKTEGTSIIWMADKNPGFKVVKKKGNRADDPKTKVVQTHSFFDFFSAPMIPDSGNAEDISEIVELLAEDDLEMGCCIKEMLIPGAVSWYTGEMGIDGIINEHNESDDSELDDDTDED